MQHFKDPDKQGIKKERRKPRLCLKNQSYRQSLAVWVEAIVTPIT